MIGKRKGKHRGSIQEIISSPLLSAMLIVGLVYITGFAAVYLLKARKRAPELGITAEEIKTVIKSSLIFSIVPSLSTVIALAYMIAIPFVVLGHYNCIPSIGQVFNAATFGILAIYVPVGISEALSYTPMLGSSAYLAFITGSIMNLKLPVAVNAMKITKREANTPAGDAVSAIAVAVSSIMTAAILAVAALMISWISPIFEQPAVKAMSNYLLPALFGSMTLGLFASTSAGSKVVKGGIKGVIPVLVIVSLVSIVARVMGMGSIMLGMVGFLILGMLPVGIITSRILWKKGIIKVVDKEAEAAAPKAE